MSKNGAQNDVAVIIRQSVAWQAIVLGVNGIALSPDAKMLYWAVTSGTHAYAVPTDLLRNTRIGKAALASAVRDLGKVGGQYG